MSGFAATIEIRSARPPWALPVVAIGLLLACVAALIADLPIWLGVALVVGIALAGVREWLAARRGGIAPGVEALWLAPGGEWRLIRDTGELEKAKLLYRQGFVTRRLVGLTLRSVQTAGRGGLKVRVWLTPAMLGRTDWRQLQVRLRNP